jgi:hypothetical protein
MFLCPSQACSALVSWPFAWGTMCRAKRKGTVELGDMVMMMDMTTMSIGMILVVGTYHLAIFTFSLLGIAAAIKYLRH